MHYIIQAFWSLYWTLEVQIYKEGFIGQLVKTIVRPDPQIYNEIPFNYKLETKKKKKQQQ